MKNLTYMRDLTDILNDEIPGVSFLFYLFHFHGKPLDLVRLPKVPGLCLIFVGPYFSEEFDHQKLSQKVGILSTEVPLIDLSTDTLHKCKCWPGMT